MLALALALPAGCGRNVVTDKIPAAVTDEPDEGYETMQLFDDVGFERGFTVVGQDTSKVGSVLLYEEGAAPVPDGGQTPAWLVARWTSGPCLFRDRAASAPNVLTDGAVKTVTLDPATRAVALRLNTIPLYNGAPGKTENWPHLLLEQSPL
jgi:hypothetical protein